MRLMGEGLDLHCSGDPEQSLEAKISTLTKQMKLFLALLSFLSSLILLGLLLFLS